MRNNVREWTQVLLLNTHVGFEVLTAVSMKIAVFWVVAQTTRCYNPEDSNLEYTCLHLHNFCATDATRATLTPVSRRTLGESITRGWTSSWFHFCTAVRDYFWMRYTSTLWIWNVSKCHGMGKLHRVVFLVLVWGYARVYMHVRLYLERRSTDFPQTWNAYTRKIF
jgi:hypothetical protein